MIAVDIHPRGALHVGELGVGSEETLSHIPGDTLYAALVVAWVATGGKGPFDAPPLRITSAFPRVGPLRLYPRPLVRVRVAEAQRDRLGKTLTQFEWCSERMWTLLLQGADMTEFAGEQNLVAGIWFHPDDRPQFPPPKGKDRLERFWATRPLVPHVALDRVNNAPNLFHTGHVAFGPGCGLWFGAEYDVPDAEQRLRQALNYLSDAGLGGLRSTGHGGFSFDLRQAGAPPEPTSAGYAVTLSRYLPAGPAEVATTLQADHAAYKLVTVGGWCQDDAGHSWRRKQVRLVREGSVIGWQGGTVPGHVVNLVPDDVRQFGDRPVLRYGLAFPVPVAEEALL